MLVNGLEHSRVVQVDAGLSSACVTDQGELYFWGRGIWGESPYPQKIMTISNPVVEMSLGHDMGVAVDDQGLAWSWGANTHGELGVGDNEPRVHPFPILSLKGKQISKAHCGNNFVICLGSNIRKDLPKPVE